jgi:DNA phosphorothioation-associated putative methyltransferase
MTLSGHDDTPLIQRHKTAIRRQGLSLPIKCLLRDGLLDASQSLFDYGCGRGQDLDLLREMSIPCDGWDPVYRPHAARVGASVVNLGYVINVIEDPQERAEVLRSAWDLCESLMVVSALAPAERATGAESRDYSDGIVTSRGTFQRFYTHQELRAYLEQQIPFDAVPAAPNIFYLFKNEDLRQQFLASRYRRQLAVPQRRVSEILFENNRDILEPLMAVVTRLGRLPGPEELPELPELVARFGSLKRAFLVVGRATGQAPWREIAARRTEDLLVYLALARFGRGQPLSQLPFFTQHDIKAFMGTYTRARDEANRLLFSVGDTDTIDRACQRSRMGHLVENALIVRRDDLQELDPVLRVYEGCARAILGEVEDANVIKLHRFSGKVTYLLCKDLDHDPDPVISLRIKVNLPNLSIDVFDYSRWEVPTRLGIDPDFLLRKRPIS